jgi:DNA-binding NtrC family response regulator
MKAQSASLGVRRQDASPGLWRCLAWIRGKVVGNRHMNVISHIVVASPDMESRRNLATILTRLGLDPICISTVSECRMMLAKENVRLVFCDRDLADGNYRDILAASRATRRQPGVILIGQRGNCDENHEAIGFGAFGVTVTPYHPTDVE